MQANIHTVNAAGLAEIAAFLADNHVKGGDYFTADMLRAWAAGATSASSARHATDVSPCSSAHNTLIRVGSLSIRNASAARPTCSSLGIGCPEDVESY